MNIEFIPIICGLNLRPSVGAFGYASVSILRDDDEYILFDVGGYGVRSIISKLRDQYNISKIVISHLHFDHCSNIDLFQDIPIYIHKNELDYLCSENSKNDNEIYRPMENYINKLNIKIVGADLQISNSANLINTFGHTSGHISLIFKIGDKNCIFAGDAVKTFTDYLNPLTNSNSFNHSETIKTKTMIKNNFDIIVPGHSSVIQEGMISKEIQLSWF